MMLLETAESATAGGNIRLKAGQLLVENVQCAAKDPTAGSGVLWQGCKSEGAKTMRANLTLAATAALLLAGGLGAQAATNDAGPVVQNSQAAQATDNQASGSMNIRQQLQTQLSKSGYTDVQIMPSSFVVRAKDNQGNPVEMVIGPDSFMQVTEVPMPNAAVTPGAGGTGNNAASGTATPPKQ